MAISQSEEERRKRPSTIVPPPSGAAASPPMSPAIAPSATPIADVARQPFAGRAAALGRLEDKGPKIGDLPRFQGRAAALARLEQKGPAATTPERFSGRTAALDRLNDKNATPDVQRFQGREASLKRMGDAPTPVGETPRFQGRAASMERMFGDRGPTIGQAMSPATGMPPMSATPLADASRPSIGTGWEADGRGGLTGIGANRGQKWASDGQGGFTGAGGNRGKNWVAGESGGFIGTGGNRGQRVGGGDQTGAAPVAGQFAGRATALARMENRGPTLGDVARFAGNTVKPAVAPLAALMSTGAPPIAAGLDSVRGVIAGAQGRELVDPNLLRNRAATVRDAAFGATFDPLKRGARALVKAIPVGETRPAPPAPASPAPTRAPGADVARDAAARPPSAGAVSQPAAGTVEVPRGTLASLAAEPKPADFERGTVSVIPSGDARAENQRFLAMREQGREANLVAQQRIAGASIQNARQMEARNLLENERRVNPERSGRAFGNAGRARGNRRSGSDRLGDLVTAITTQPQAAPSVTLGDIRARDATTAKTVGEAAAAEAAAVAEQQNAIAAQRKQQTLSELMAQLTTEQRIVALNGGDPRASGNRFQIATNEEADPLNPGSALKTSYIIDQAGNARPVAGAAAAPSIPAGAIERLRADPKLAADFDQKYGAGASARILG